MKNLILLMLVTALISSGCDIVDEPFGSVGEGGWNPGFDQLPTFNDTTVTRRRIILEEFTGHTCPNCPKGADIVTDIITKYPDDVISVAIHNSGSFSVPDMSNPEKPFPSDFRTETGRKLLIRYKVPSFPGGMLNRTLVNGDYPVDYFKWDQEVTVLLNDPAYVEPRFKLFLTATYNNEPNNLSVRVKYKVEALKSLSGSYAIAGYLAESYIIAPQIDSRLTNSYVADYEHNHVLRIGFPGNGDGRTVFTDPTKGDVNESTEESEYLFTKIDESWVVGNMKILVFIYNPITGEMFGAEEFELTN